MGGKRRGAPGYDEDFTFVSPVVKYLLFIFNFIFWVSASTDFQVLFLSAETVWRFKDILFVGFLVTFSAAGSH